MTYAEWLKKHNDASAQLENAEAVLNELEQTDCEDCPE